MNAPKRVVILGGGFAGMAAARYLERHLPVDGSVTATLVSRDNYLLFTPMLAEVAAGALAPGHIASPLRGFLRRVEVFQAEAASVDTAAHTATVHHKVTGEPHTLPYDHLVLALGSTTSYHHVPGAAEHTLGFKTLGDAERARGRVVDCFEQATMEEDAARRRALLTFVVAGGGYTGVELAAALADYLRTLRRFYPRLAGERMYLVLAHHGQRLLEELPASAAAYTLGLLQRQGIAVRLGTGVAQVSADSVELEPGGTLPTRTVFWTAGVAPDPLVGTLGLSLSRHGAVVVDEHLAVPDHPGLWAVGDCAAVPQPGGGSYGPTAQNAEREGPLVARNVLAQLSGAPLKEFTYHSAGMLASLGERRAVGELFGHQFSGTLAWLVWRMVYLAKLPGLDRQLRVGLDWVLDFALPPTLLGTGGTSTALPASSSATPAASATAHQ